MFVDCCEELCMGILKLRLSDWQDVLKIQGWCRFENSDWIESVAIVYPWKSIKFSY